MNDYLLLDGSDYFLLSGTDRLILTDGVLPRDKGAGGGGAGTAVGGRGGGGGGGTKISGSANPASYSGMNCDIDYIKIFYGYQSYPLGNP